MVIGQLRSEDVFRRIGGEEFRAILGQTVLVEGARFIERIRDSIEKATIQYKGNQMHITLSIGIAAFTNDENPSTPASRTDSLLYAAQSRG